MKRFRWLNFYIDTGRNFFRLPGITPQVFEQQKQQQLPFLQHQYGYGQIDEKFDRWLSIDPPALCVPVEYHELLREVEGAYIRGDYYPALTGACCLGERILNHLVLGLRDEHKISSFYRGISRKKSIDDWRLAVKILKDWKVLDDNLATEFFDLLDLRNPAVHFGEIKNRKNDSLKSLNLAYKITDLLFGMSHPRFFMSTGELYIKRDFESDPLTRLFIAPHCSKVGYMHEIKNIKGQNCLEDVSVYPEGEISDDEFVKCREEFRNR